MWLKNNIFLHSDYKTFLLAQEQTGTHKGFRSRLAESTGCQNAFVSQVLNGNVNFNLEQGLGIGQFLRLDESELQYFLWMIELKRAGTEELRQYFLTLMSTIRESRLNLKGRVKAPLSLSLEAQAKYYSGWLYSAVHIAVMIPKLNSVSKLAEVFNLTEQQIQSAVDFLLDNGLIETDGVKLKSGRIQIHLGNDSPQINKHHSNWRIEALKSLDQPTPKDLHYSGVSCLGRADIDKLRSLLAETIENYVRLVEVSAEETIFALNIDFFRVLKDRE